mmetsp:Transcript_9150/g.17803  ORF Transcript_9150/g.17803 Transcript_9150/m.17803 type:complete len:80 (-) Transcript_9150:162-401(-)
MDIKPVFPKKKRKKKNTLNCVVHTRTDTHIKKNTRVHPEMFLLLTLLLEVSLPLPFSAGDAHQLAYSGCAYIHVRHMCT